MNSPGDEILDLKEIALFFWRWWWLIVACALGAVLLLVLIDQGQDSVHLPAEEKRYIATTILQLYEDPSNTPVTNAESGRFYATALIRESVLEAVIDDLGLEISTTALGQQVTSEFVPEESQIILNVEGESEHHLIDIANAIPLAFEGDEQAQQQRRLEVIIQALQESQDMLQAEIDRTVERLGELDEATAPDQVVEREQLQLFLNQYLHRAALLQDVLYQIQLQHALPPDMPILLPEEAYMQIIKSITRPRIEVISSAIIDTVTDTSLEATREQLQITSFRVLLTAGVIGAILGMGAAFLRETLDDSLKSVTQIEHLTRLPVLAAIEHHSAAPPAAVLTRSTASSAEAYRLLLVRLGFSARDTPFQTLLVTCSLKETIIEE